VSESILLEAERLTSGERNKSYGEPIDNFQHTVGLINAQFADKLRVPLTAEDFAILMMLVKLSRLNTTPTHRDSIVDVAGYAKTLQRVIEERARRAAIVEPSVSPVPMDDE
jgi:hypothetical protein